MIASFSTPMVETKSPSVARVLSNHQLCKDHYRLTFSVPVFAEARAGQFVHVSPIEQNDCVAASSNSSTGYRTYEWDEISASEVLHAGDVPMLRRAYSISALRRPAAGAEIDIIYRVVGKSTRWLASLQSQDNLSVMGPMGNAFPIRAEKKLAWLIAGGVGLPPMLWLAEALRDAGRSTIAFCGAQSADLLALSCTNRGALDATATRAVPAAMEFAQCNTPVVISTDDGTLGFRGHIGAALSAFAQANPPDPSALVVYTCGPERMMEFVARFCIARNIECHVCMERAMACGTGMCQSCVVPVVDPEDRAGWRYRLCCTEGPIFPADQIIWGEPPVPKSAAADDAAARP